MEISALLAPILGGYHVLTRSRWARFQVGRLTGYHLFFRSALAGVLLLIAAWPISMLLKNMLPRAVWEYMAHFPFDDALFFLVTVMLAVAIPPITNLVTRNRTDNHYAKAAARDGGNLTEWIIQEALGDKALIEISTKRGKSYIGLPQFVGSPVRWENDVVLLPLFSGYRKTETHQLVITADYRSVIRRLAAKEDGENISPSAHDLLIALPYEVIASARRFNLDVYREHFLAGNNEDGEEKPTFAG